MPYKKLTGKRMAFFLAELKIHGSEQKARAALDISFNNYCYGKETIPGFSKRIEEEVKRFNETEIYLDLQLEDVAQACQYAKGLKKKGINDYKVTHSSQQVVTTEKFDGNNNLISRTVKRTPANEIITWG
ncbi:hypothetical protein [Moorena sp. SIO3B2]|uniref:hypothetical protein n=1 Tax=Moorena sp. SIO3B2 TaxID=2607827 RepID=UPI0013CAE575|nr:hypothetical protein [Moorena sp. SIO3B2]NEP31741.1 hypothetical protein [Moorena sp. SIO3B2]NEP31766.1 hypothetical protein [Moorena sp. SIO3B2]